MTYTGWGQYEACEKMHYFRDGKSLCGIHKDDPQYPTPRLDPDAWHQVVCKTCKKLRKSEGIKE